MAVQANGGNFKPDYKAVREAIAHVMEKDEDYDDGEHARFGNQTEPGSISIQIASQTVSLGQLSKTTWLQRACLHVAAQQLTANRS